MTDSLCVGSFNVRGLRDRTKRRAVYEYLESKRMFICFLQEVHLRDRGDVIRYSREWVRGGSVWSVGGVHSSGVGILFGSKEVKVEEDFVVVQRRIYCSILFCIKCRFIVLSTYQVLNVDL